MFWMYEMCKYCVKKVYFFGFKEWKMLINGKYLNNFVLFWIFICPQVPVHNLTPSLNTLIIPLPPPVPSHHMAAGSPSYPLLMRNNNLDLQSFFVCFIILKPSSAIVELAGNVATRSINTRMFLKLSLVPNVLFTSHQIFYTSHRTSADFLRQNVAICTFEASEVEMFSSFLWHRMPCYFHGCQLSI